MEKFEYAFLSVPRFREVNEFVKLHSKEGWRLVSHNCVHLDASGGYAHFVIMERKCE